MRTLRNGCGLLLGLGLAWIALASLAPASASAQTSSDAERVLPRPMSTALLLADGPPLRGQVLAWSELGVRFLPEGEEFDRVVLWHDLRPPFVYNLRRRFLDRDDAAGWLRLGILMLEMGDARRAEQALGVASRLDEALEPIADRARELFEEGGDPREALADEAPVARPADSDAERSGADPVHRPDLSENEDKLAWPTLSPQEHAQAAEEMKQRCLKLLNGAGFGPLPFTETEHFLVFSDMAPSERRAVIGSLDQMYNTLLRAFEIPDGARMYHGKCAVFIFNTRDRFLSFERQAFNQDASAFSGVHHAVGPWSHIVFSKQGSQHAFLSLLVHEATHSFMHRYRTARELPTWANEGLADYVAGFVVRSSNEPVLNWTQAKAYVMQGRDPREIMRQSYRDGSWPSEFSYSVSHMLVRFLLKHRPREFKAWIDAIKEGADWEDALEAHFGVSAEVLARGFADAIRNEPHYSP